MGAFLAALLFFPATWALQDGRIGVLYISDPVRAWSFDFMRTEPIFSLTFVAASLRGFGGWHIDDVHRAIRLYLPRNHKDLVTRFDVIVLDNANRRALNPGQIELLARGVREAQRGLLMTGGWESFGGTGAGQPPWGETAVGKLLPTEDVENAFIESGRVAITHETHEFVASLPWNRKSPFMGKWPHNLVTVKHGGQQLAHTDRNAPLYGGEDHPLFVTWEIPEGARVFACTGEIALMAYTHSALGVNYVCWDYYGDFISNLMIYLAKRPVPQDVDLVHAVRTEAFRSRTRISLMMGLIEFIENFGANTQNLLSKIDEVEEEISEGISEYIDLHFEELLSRYERIGGMLDELEERAMEAKHRALLWVYVVEWLVVMGTAMIVGFVVWSLMVRRKLFREVRVTRILE